MKRQIIVISSILTLAITVVPAFLVNVTTKDVNEDNKNIIEVGNVATKNDEDITTFSSTTCYKKTYYINSDNIDVYSDNTGKDQVIHKLKENDAIISYYDDGRYMYSEFDGPDGKNMGWVKKNSDDLKGIIYKKSSYVLDININNQIINVYKEGNVIKNFKCSTGKFGDQDSETPTGVFSAQCKGDYFYSNKYEEGGKYYIKFFANYLIHSVPVDKKGNIIKEENDKLGYPVSHGCIRVSIKDAKWLYDNIPCGSTIFIHY